MSQFIVSWVVRCRRRHRRKRKLDVEKEPLLSGTPGDDSDCWRSLFKPNTQSASSSYSIRPYKSTPSTKKDSTWRYTEVESDA